MAFSIHTSHRAVFLVPLLLYIALVIVCAIVPAMSEVERESQLKALPVSPIVKRGREVYRSFNCAACHTQQIRGDEHLAITLPDGRRVTPVLAADQRYGTEASTGADYDHQDPAMMGTQRTGPDLMTVGDRLPGIQWHHWHLYNPSAVSPDSVMPPHRFLYTTEPPTGEAEFDYQKVDLIDGLGVPKGKELWATPDAVALVEYLLSLQRRAP